MIKSAPFNRCIECNEIITNPICPSCLAQRIIISLSEYDLDLIQHISGFNIEGETKCLLCGNGIGLCAHCYCKDIYDFLAKKNSTVAKSFLSQFDYDLRQELV